MNVLPDILGSGGDDDLALVAGTSPVRYGELRAEVRNLAAALAHGGLGRGDRVLILLPNDASFVIGMFATWRAGGVVLPMDCRSPPEQVVRLARDCDATGILCDARVAAQLEGRWGDISSLRIVFVRGPTAPGAGGAIASLRYEDAICFDGPAPALAARPEEFALLAYTSGSTGCPKGAIHSHASLLSSLIFTRDHLRLVRDDRVLVSFPLYHLFSLRVVLVHLMVGATVIVAPDILAGLKAAPATRPNALVLVPAACALVVDNFASALAQCAPLVRRVCIGSAAIAPALLERLRRLLPHARVYIPYGMTEARIGFLEPVPGRAERRLGAVDPNLELRVLDENGRPVEKGIGEIVLRGPALMRGYWHGTERENARLHAEGLRTGDLMEVTERGERFLIGRLDDVINVGGEKVFPAEVEAVLLSHPAIRDVRVTGAEDPRGVRGHVVRAAIVLEPAAMLDRDDLLAHCRARLEPYKLPVIVDVVPEIGRNDMGKVARPMPLGGGVS